MSQFEDVFMAGFFDAMGGEEKVAAEEMPVLSKALGNLGLLDEEAGGMPILKQALENLGLNKEASEEPASMLEALAQAYGPAVAAEREKVAMEKDAAGALRTKAKSILRGLKGAWTGSPPIGGRSYKTKEMIQELSGKGPGRVSKGKAAKVLGVRGAAVGGGALVAGAGVKALLKKKEKEKKGKK